MTRTLTPRQHQALDLAAQGLQRPEIAERMGIAQGTVRDHLRVARWFLGARTTAEAVANAKDQGLI